ncbi:sodium-dependent transporter [Halarchaeum sp. P4]|uniref:sodium-dependent transporter n=1 Tax=Halarchaeum sp. P4 TaxID=3421639 RepID=UPI003EBE78CD
MQQEQWSSRFGFLVASIGAAVGLGNIWRFSAVVGQNGGGAYLVPYFIAAFVFGVPLMILEMSVGRDLKADVVSAFRRIRKEYAVVGWLVGGTVLVVLSYYLVITGWVFSFLLFTVFGVETTFAGFTSTLQPILAFVLCTVVVGAIVSFGVQRGIERIAKVFIPFVFLVLLGLVVYAATLPGFSRGLSFFLTPKFSVLSNPLVWSAAFGQVFFSLSVGQGIMLTYGSYLDEATNIPKSTLLIAVADLGVAMLSGLVIFPLVFSFGLQPAMGTELAFTTLPTAFDAIGGILGTLVGVAFFGALFVAAITPSVSMMEVGVASLTRTTTLSRKRASVAVTAFILLLGLPSALSYSSVGLQVFGQPFLDLLDDSVGTLGLPVTAILIAVVFTWIQDRESVQRQLGDGVVLPIVKYVVPSVLLAVTALRLTAGVDFAAWRRLPGSGFVGTPLQSGVTLAVLALVAVGGWLVLRYLPRRRRRRRSDSQS